MMRDDYKFTINTYVLGAVMGNILMGIHNMILWKSDVETMHGLC